MADKGRVLRFGSVALEYGRVELRVSSAKVSIQPVPRSRELECASPVTGTQTGEQTLHGPDCSGSWFASSAAGGECHPVRRGGSHDGRDLLGMCTLCAP
jgi:hypothetical protein